MQYLSREDIEKQIRITDVIEAVKQAFSMTEKGLVARADKIFCDSKAAVLSESGDLLIPIRQGLIREDKICGGLGEVINGTLPGRETEDEIIIFETVGIAAQDLVTAGMIYEKMCG